MNFITQVQSFVFDAIITTIIHPIFISLTSLYVAFKAYKLQKKSDEDLKRIEGNIDRMENDVKGISKIQDKLAFEEERNRLMNFFNDTDLSKENKEDIKNGVKNIFKEKEYKINFIENNQINYTAGCKITFTKESEKEYALPKVFYPDRRIHSFPFFCVHVSEVQNQPKIISESCYYLTYHVSTTPELRGWYISKECSSVGPPQKNRFKIIFSIYSYIGGANPSADQFCHNSSVQ